MPVAVEVCTVEFVVVSPINFSFIDGTTKHVPITKEHPTIPLKNGTNTDLPNPFDCLKFAFEVLLEITSNLFSF